MQKDYAKEHVPRRRLPVPEGMVVSRLEAAKEHLLPPPYVVKPIAEGSSVGVFIVTEAARRIRRRSFTREDWAFGDKVLVERYIPGKELTCAVMGDRGARRHRDRADGAILRLRGEIRRRRLQTHPSGPDFTKCLPRGPKTGVWRRIARLAAAA